MQFLQKKTLKLFTAVKTFQITQSIILLFTVRSFSVQWDVQ